MGNSGWASLSVAVVREVESTIARTTIKIFIVMLAMLEGRAESR